MITVVLALVSGAAFAQISGDFLAASTIFQGTSEQKDADDNLFFNMGGSKAEGKWGIRFGEGAASGRIVYRLHDNSPWGWFAWRPVEQFRLKYGWDRDGEWGAAQISGWGFTAGAKDLVAFTDYGGGGIDGVARPGPMRGWAWYPGIGDGNHYSLMMSIFPIDGLAINLALPGRYDPARLPNINTIKTDSAYDAFTASREASLQLSFLHANVSYKLQDIGLANVAFVGDGGLGKDMEKKAGVGTLYASFFLTALKEMGIGEFDLGFNYHMPFKNAADIEEDGRMGVGLGYRINIEAFQLKLRAGANISGKTSTGDALPTLVGVQILPQYKFTALTFYFYAGFGMEMPEKGDTRSAWFINPYISVPIGGATFWAGLKVIQNPKPATGPHPINFSIPFGFSANY